MSLHEEREVAIRAMGEAARVAWKRAARHGLKVEIWRNGEIVEVDPNDLLREEYEAEPVSSRVQETDD